MKTKYLCILATSMASGVLLADVTEPVLVDGYANESFWKNAHVITDLHAVEPYTKTIAEHGQTVRISSTPEGVVAHFDIKQPSGIIRTKPSTQRDKADAADRVNLIIDYDNKGLLGYNFTVTLAGSIEDGVVGRNSFNSDWDGKWQHAVVETEHGWQVEMLIPWTVTAMDPVDTQNRTVGVYVDRVIKATGHRYAYPAIRFSQSDYTKSFAQIELENFSASQFMVFPYASVAYDNIDGDADTKIGLDWFYRPSNSFQMIGSLNPDFGQVESDNLVVDFSAIEVFFSDKRPFFTENNEDFSLALPDFGQLIYTRRMGATRADNGQISDIDIATKLRTANRYGSIAYLGVQENEFSDGFGNRFQVLRPRTQLGDVIAGYTFLLSEKPFLDREAVVHAADAEWRYNSIIARTQYLLSYIESQTTTKKDSGLWVTIDFNPSVSSQHTLEYFNYGENLDLNDMGFVRRNNIEQIGYLGRFVYSQPFSLAAIDELEVTPKFYLKQTQYGEPLPTQASLKAGIRDRSAGKWSFVTMYQSQGVDDLIARGNGLWEQPDRLTLQANYESARRGDAAWSIDLERGEEGMSKHFFAYKFGWQHFIGDNLTLQAKLAFRDSDDWLIWDEATQFIRFDRNVYNLELNADWFVTEKQELRLKFEWLNIEAKNGTFYQLINEQILSTGLPASDLSINTMGLQLRYRYKISTLSDLFIVYARGGFNHASQSNDDPYQNFADALSLRDTDQVLFKLRLQF